MWSLRGTYKVYNMWYVALCALTLRKRWYVFVFENTKCGGGTQSRGATQTLLNELVCLLPPRLEIIERFRRSERPALVPQTIIIHRASRLKTLPTSASWGFRSLSARRGDFWRRALVRARELSCRRRRVARRSLQTAELNTKKNTLQQIRATCGPTRATIKQTKIVSRSCAGVAVVPPVIIIVSKRNATHTQNTLARPRNTRQLAERCKHAGGCSAPEHRAERSNTTYGATAQTCGPAKRCVVRSVYHTHVQYTIL